MNTTRENKFKKNPVRTSILLILTFIIILGLLLKVVDIYKGYKFYKDWYHYMVSTRYIRLRENSPLQNKIVPAAENEIAGKNKAIKYRTDSNGFVVCSKAYYNKPDLKIFFMGGSTTQCFDVDEDNRFPGLVGRYLEDSLKIKVNSYNAGVVGNNIFHSLDILLNKVIPYHPQYLVFMHVNNDATVFLNYGASYWTKSLSRSLIMDSVTFVRQAPPLGHSLYPNIMRAIRIKLNKMPKIEFLDAHRVTLDSAYLASFKDEYRKALVTFIQVCRTYNIHPVMMTEFAKFGVGNPPHSGPGMDMQILVDSLNTIVRQTARDMNIDLIDMQALISTDPKKYVFDTMHFNDTGSVYVSKVITESLLQIMRKKQ